MVITIALLVLVEPLTDPPPPPLHDDDDDDEEEEDPPATEKERESEGDEVSKEEA